MIKYFHNGWVRAPKKTKTDMEEIHMKKSIALLLATALVVALFAGCTGTTVIIGECTCPCVTEGDNTPTENTTETTTVTASGTLRTGLAILADVSGSQNAGEKNGKAQFDVDLAAVLVDENGVIVDCKLDSLGATLEFDGKGAITSDLTKALQTKNELGDGYNMKLYAGSKYEWYEQAAAVAKYAIGKTAEQLKNGAVNEAGKASDADLAAVATITIGSYVDAIVAAAENAQALGAEAGDKLYLASNGSLGSSVSAGEKAGTAQLDLDVVALTENGGTITSCTLDSLQGKVNFDTAGVITSDLTKAPQTKNELGDSYNMKLYGNAKYEWYEQAASFCKYVTGKTADQVLGIAVNEATKPTEADLTATVTIAIGGYQALIAKALGK